MENILVCSKSDTKLSGIYFNIYTNANSIYNYKIKATLKKGDSAFVYCEDKRKTKLISRRNIFTNGLEKEFKFSIKGIGSYINFGILFANSDISYELDIKYIGIMCNDIILNNENNINLVRGAFIKNNDFREIKKSNIDEKNITIKNIIIEYNINQIYISSPVIYFKKIMNTYKLENYSNEKDSTLFIGIYYEKDLEILSNHFGNKIIIWLNGNTKIQNFNKFAEKIKTLNNILHLSINQQVQQQLEKFGIKSNKINIDINQYFTKIEYSNKIFVYNGNSNNKKQYNIHIYDKLKEKLVDYEFIFSQQLEGDIENMYKKGNECIVAIILTENYSQSDFDIIYGLRSLNILVICNNNFDDSIKWNNLDDIELIIKYRNIYLFNKEIQTHKNLLFVCTDYPSWGGAATNTHELIKWYNLNSDHKAFGLFFHNDKINEKYENSIVYNIEGNDSYKETINRIKEYFGGDPNLIILRNYIDQRALKCFDCPKYFLIPGIFKQNLIKYSNKLSNDELNIYLNRNIINTINICDKCFTNSFETSRILNKLLNKTINVLNFNYIPFYGNYIKFDEKQWRKRRYTIGVIISDFNRKIKNIKLINKIFSLLPNVNKIVIGKNNNKIIGQNIKRYNLLSHENLLTVYPKIQYIINTSFYESCSNVIIEAKYNGCIVQYANDDNYKIIIKSISDTLKNNIPFDINSVSGESLNLNKTLDMSNTNKLDNINEELKYNIVEKSTESLLEEKNEETLIKNSSNSDEYFELINMEQNKEQDDINRYLRNYIKVELLPDDFNNKIIVKLEANKILNSKKLDNEIMIISTQFPHYGGAATLAYKIHETLLKNGYNSHCLFIYDKLNCNYNPYNLANVYLMKLDGNYKYKESCNNSYKLIKEKVKNPKIIIGFNYISPVVGKNLYPQSKVFYYITGSKYISTNNLSAVEYLNSTKRSINELDDDELYCLNVSDYIIPNSELTHNIFLKMFPEFKVKYTKIFGFEPLFSNEDDNETETKNTKIHDIVVVSSRFNRNVKNIGLINKIFSHQLLKSYNKACIGMNSNKFIKEANAHYGLKNHSDTMKILKQSKILLITSKYESFSLTLLDGVNSDCIVLSNINVGSSKYLDENYVIDNENSETWASKIITILKNYEYHKKIFKFNKPVIKINEIIEYLFNYEYKLNKKNIVFVSVDKPYKGGCGTNTYNMIKSFQNSDEINPIGIFISNEDDEEGVNPLNIENIYYVQSNEKIEKNIEKVLQQIENKYYIDALFVKNYKALACIQWINNNNNKNYKIIFSPSGLRTINNEKSNFNTDDTLSINSYNQSIGLHNFISSYDKDLEKIVYNNCQCVIPNSNLTYDLINKTFDLKFNLRHPCNITYIDYKDINTNDDFSLRKYDIAFICYSWNRKVKNFDLVKKILDRDELNNFKILIIGKKNIKFNKKNIEQINNCSNEEILNYLLQTKLLCVPSLFDSSPNILKEGLMCGCNILLSKNVGSYELFDKNNIIEKLDNVEEWMHKIKYNMNKKVKLKNFYPWIVKDQLKNNILSFCEDNLNILSESIIQESGVGIYKLPAEWNNMVFENSNRYSFEFDKSINILDTIKNDIYFKLFINNDKYNCKYYHYITVNTNNKINKYTQPYYIYPYLSQYIFIWEICSPHILNQFKNAKYYFFRGNYYDAYSQFINNKSTTILYPATALVYDNNFNLIVNKIINHKFNYVLYDDITNKNLWEKMFPNSKLLNFNKPVSSNVINLNIKRHFDYIFVATENQCTKNRHLFIDFVLYCERKKVRVNIINVGKLNQYYTRLINLKYVNLVSYERTKYSNIIELFNDSKINLIFSGRDALPRVVTESLACGCFNLALDTISDGKYLYNKNLGEMLSYPKLEKIYNEVSKSISYLPNDIIFEDILRYKEKSFDHKWISYTFLKELSYQLNIN